MLLPKIKKNVNIQDIATACRSIHQFRCGTSHVCVMHGHMHSRPAKITPVCQLWGRRPSWSHHQTKSQPPLRNPQPTSHLPAERRIQIGPCSCSNAIAQPAHEQRAGTHTYRHASSGKARDMYSTRRNGAKQAVIS